MIVMHPRSDGGVARGFLSRLVRDKRGNTMAMMAAALVPLVGMIGGGFDLSRMYLVKTRLQHACDAGALAGRKAMGGGVWSQSSYMPRTQANRFFDANFDGSPYGVNTVTRTFTEDSGKVSGTASTTVPMTLMRVMGFEEKDLAVSCDAEMRLPNTDVMFVLDVTGSMGETLSGDTRTKIAGLRSAVKCFFEVVARLDTTDPCSGGTPTGGVGDQVQVRFGFVPYDMNVNVGRLLPSRFFADSWRYQSRQQATVYGTFASWQGSSARNASAWTADTDEGTSITANTNGACNSGVVVPADTFVITGGPYWPDRGTESDAGWRAYVPVKQRNFQRNYNSTTKVCKLTFRERDLERPANWTRVGSASVSGAVPFKAWTYGQTSLNIASLKSGDGWNSSLTLPIGAGHTDASIPWDGCIEERATVAQASYSPIPAGARDLNIDEVPSAGDPDSLWGPALQHVIYPRKLSYADAGSRTMSEVTTFNQEWVDTNGRVRQPYTHGSMPDWSLSSSFGYSCPAEGRKLVTWETADAFEDYVETLQPGGNTYHDIGLLWGARLMSPTGIFASENALTPRGGEIERHLIFMTDGDACTDVDNYQGYGLSWYDRRQTDPMVIPTSGCTTTGTLTQQVNARSSALCSAVKNKNITLWVIWFGTSNTTIENQLRACATPTRFIIARNSAQLQAAFRSIADEIAALRLTG